MRHLAIVTLQARLTLSTFFTSLPFFTSHDHAQTFVGEYTKERNRVYPFQMLGVKGSLLAQMLPATDILVMNDRSADEIVCRTMTPRPSSGCGDQPTAIRIPKP